jgi:hypothetical protein
MSWLQPLIEALTTLAIHTVSPGEAYDYAWKHKEELDDMDIVNPEVMINRFGDRLNEKGVSLCRKPEGMNVIAPLRGSLSYAESTKDACRRIGAIHVADGHLHPFQAAIPSYGDLRTTLGSEYRGGKGICVGRAKQSGGSRVLCVEAPNGLSDDDLLHLSDIRENVENSDRFDLEINMPLPDERKSKQFGRLIVGLGSVPIRSEEDAEGDEQLFCDIVNNPSDYFDVSNAEYIPQMRCRIHDGGGS